MGRTYKEISSFKNINFERMIKPIIKIFKGVPGGGWKNKYLLMYSETESGQSNDEVVTRDSLEEARKEIPATFNIKIPDSEYYKIITGESFDEFIIEVYTNSTFFTLSFNSRPPHLAWLEKMEEYRQNFLTVHPEMNTLLDISEEEMENFKWYNEEEMFFIYAMDLITNIKRAQEIELNGKLKFEKFVKINEESFHPPFDKIIITKRGKDGFHDSFLQVFKMHNVYKDVSKNKELPVYCIRQKVIDRQDNKSSYFTPGLYRTTMQIFVIPEKLPRIIISMGCLYVCKKCSRAKLTNMMNNVIPNQDNEKYCMKTLNTMKFCTDLEGKFTYAEACFEVISELVQVIQRITKTPERIERIKSITGILNNISNPEKEIHERKYIEIKGNTYFYREPAQTRQSSGTHASPCEHLRRESTRRLKNGEIIPVKSSIVNKGGKKPVYIIKGDDK